MTAKQEIAGRWIRVSTGAQDEASQEPDIDQWILSHDYIPGPTYRLHGKSASKGKQDADLDRMFDDMKHGLLDVLVVWAADRIERRGALAALLLAKRAKDAGGRIEYIKDPHLNVAHEMSDVMLALTGSLAYQESQRKSQRIHAKHSALHEAGGVIGKAPWGYMVTCKDCGKPASGLKGRDKCCRGIKTFAPTELGGTWVPVIFDMVLAHKSLADIAAHLDDNGVQPQGVRGREATRWNEGSISQMVANPAYAGRRVQKGSTVDIPALVSFEDQQAAQAVLASRTRTGRDTVKREKALLFPLCGNPDCLSIRARKEGIPEAELAKYGRPVMYRTTCGSGKNRADYYYCKGNGPQRKGCGNMLHLDTLDRMAIEWVSGQHDAPYMESQWVPGNDSADARARILADMDAARNAAIEAKDYGMVGSITQTYADKLADLPEAEPGRWAYKPTGKTIGEHFAELDLDGKRSYLLDRKVTAWVTKKGDAVWGDRKTYCLSMDSNGERIETHTHLAVTD